MPLVAGECLGPCEILALIGIPDVVEVQFPAPATLSAVTLRFPGATGAPLVRGPGVLVWVQ
jgi:hypothetical protein